MWILPVFIILAFFKEIPIMSASEILMVALPTKHSLKEQLQKSLSFEMSRYLFACHED